MPSMHVALTLWAALVLRKTFLAPLTWAYVPIIWIGSVVLGWHYFTDGLVGMIGIVLIWCWSPFLIKGTNKILAIMNPTLREEPS